MFIPIVLNNNDIKIVMEVTARLKAVLNDGIISIPYTVYSQYFYE